MECRAWWLVAQNYKLMKARQTDGVKSGAMVKVQRAGQNLMLFPRVAKAGEESITTSATLVKKMIHHLLQHLPIEVSIAFRRESVGATPHLHWSENQR
jgi:predicted solute-binding protein